ncbi:MAG: hypothetical protein LQ338_005274 [Usnochroma carphineum]|nr:MAG: hypothetical protein LQ338_005274 [Usnochroma carphineum]
MFTDNIQQISPPLPPPALGPRDSLLPFPADHHLPYLVPALFYWVISKLLRGSMLVRIIYKLHTSAEHLTKNRASRRDVIKFALIQQAAQCLLGYLMANDKEQFVSPEYATAVWARRLRTAQVKSELWTSYVGLTVPRIMDGSSLLGLTAPKVFAQDQFSKSVANSTHVVMDPNLGAVPFTSGELFLAKTMYWVLFPTLQYVAAMILADTFQYFTHRAFHVNKWLYSKPALDFSLIHQLTGLARTHSLDAP